LRLGDKINLLVSPSKVVVGNTTDNNTGAWLNSTYGGYDVLTDANNVEILAPMAVSFSVAIPRIPTSSSASARDPVVPSLRKLCTTRASAG
jgi:hypothetical protein